MKLGFVDADELLNKINAVKFIEWLRFSELEPFGSKVEQMQMAGLRAQVANYLRKKNAKAFDASDFIVGYKRQTMNRPMSVEEIYRQMTGR